MATSETVGQRYQLEVSLINERRFTLLAFLHEHLLFNAVADCWPMLRSSWGLFGTTHAQQYSVLGRRGG